MKELDKIIQKRFKDEHGLELSMNTMAVLRKAIEYKIIKMVERLEVLRLPDFELFPRYVKTFRWHNKESNKSIIKKLRSIDRDF